MRMASRFPNLNRNGPKGAIRALFSSMKSVSPTLNKKMELTSYNTELTSGPVEYTAHCGQCGGVETRTGGDLT